MTGEVSGPHNRSVSRWETRIPKIERAGVITALAARVWFFGETLGIVSGGQRNYIASGASDASGKIIQDDLVALKE